MGFYIFLFIRIIILPVFLFKFFKDKSENPLWDINILMLPIMWAIFFFFYPYGIITLICAFAGIIILLILCPKSFASGNLKGSGMLLLINILR